MLDILEGNVARFTLVLKDAADVVVVAPVLTATLYDLSAKTEVAVPVTTVAGALISEVSPTAGQYVFRAESVSPQAAAEMRLIVRQTRQR